jgi:predicted Zn-dependent protease
MKLWLTTIALLSVSVTGCAASTAPASRAPEPETALAARLFEHGKQFARSGDSIRAEQYLGAALDAGLDAKRVLPELLATLVRAGRLRTAINYARPYLRQNPDVALRHLVATIYLALERPLDAQRELETVLREHPDHAPSRYLCGVVSWETYADEAETRRFFEEYLALEPSGERAAEVLQWLSEHAPEQSSSRRSKAEGASTASEAYDDTDGSL